jgi:LPXTG-motif cell wall-anchored protein
LTLLKSSLRRSATVVASALIGLGGAAAVAAPASAHDAAITGTTTCNASTGKHDVTWTLTNDWGTDATVQNLQIVPNDAPVDDKKVALADGYTLPQKSNNVDGVVTFTQSLDSDATSITISFDAKWTDYTDTGNSATVDLGGPCSTPPPASECTAADQAAFTHSFEVTSGGSDATITLNPGLDLCQGEPVTLVSYYAPKPEFSVPQYEFDHDSGTITTDTPQVKLHVDVPDCNTQVDLFFGTPDDIIKEITDTSGRYGDKKLGSSTGLGHRSVGKLGAYNGGSKACQTPEVQPVSNCNGTTTLKFSNDKTNAAYAVDFKVTGTDFDKTVTVEAGKGASLDVPASAGDITVSYPGSDDQTIKWTRPADCALPTVVSKNTCDTVTITVTNPKDVETTDVVVTYGDATQKLTVAPGDSETATFKPETATFKPGSAKYATVAFPDLGIQSVKTTLKVLDCSTGGSGGGLPVTGSAASTVAIGAAVLLIAGGVLFFVARRRRVRFTA